MDIITESSVYSPNFMWMNLAMAIMMMLLVAAVGATISLIVIYIMAFVILDFDFSNISKLSFY